MAEPRRDPHQTKEIGVARLKESYEKANKTVCPPEQVRQFEQHYEKHVLPRVYDKK